jgi:hypothetical protein
MEYRNVASRTRRQSKKKVFRMFENEKNLKKPTKRTQQHDRKATKKKKTEREKRVPSS